MNYRSTNNSNFRYGHFTNSCLEIFDKLTVLEPIESSHVQEVYPSVSMDESSIEIEFETDRSIYLDLRDIRLQIKVGLQKRRLFDDFMKKDEHGKLDMCMSFTDAEENISYPEFSGESIRLEMFFDRSLRNVT